MQPDVDRVDSTIAMRIALKRREAELEGIPDLNLK